MKEMWVKLNSKFEAMSKRERLLVAAAILFVIASLADTFLLTPMISRQKMASEQLRQQQVKLSAVQSQIAALMQASSLNANSPQRIQLNQIRQDIATGNAFLKSSREKLVQPEKMAGHIRQLLNRNNSLQLVLLQTLPVTPLLDGAGEVDKDADYAAQTAATATTQEQLVYKHGIQLTLRGSYLELMQYVNALEKLPQQMYWGKAQMSVVEYPVTDLTLTLYTLSLDKTWLQI